MSSTIASPDPGMQRLVWIDNAVGASICLELFFLLFLDFLLWDFLLWDFLLWDFLLWDFLDLDDLDFEDFEDLDDFDFDDFLDDFPRLKRLASTSAEKVTGVETVTAWTTCQFPALNVSAQALNMSPSGTVNDNVASATGAFFSLHANVPEPATSVSIGGSQEICGW
jgi:hypothetical protein